MRSRPEPIFFFTAGTGTKSLTKHNKIFESLRWEISHINIYILFTLYSY